MCLNILNNLVAYPAVTAGIAAARLKSRTPLMGSTAGSRGQRRVAIASGRVGFGGDGASRGGASRVGRATRGGSAAGRWPPRRVVGNGGTASSVASALPVGRLSTGVTRHRVARMARGTEAGPVAIRVWWGRIG
jgi:hypothetical protein